MSIPRRVGLATGLAFFCGGVATIVTGARLSPRDSLWTSETAGTSLALLGVGVFVSFAVGRRATESFRRMVVAWCSITVTALVLSLALLVSRVPVRSVALVVVFWFLAGALGGGGASVWLRTPKAVQRANQADEARKEERQ
jgi:hypothetical protein